MCLVTYWKFPKITLKDKVVYKVLLKQSDGTLYSPFMDSEYKLNKLYKEPFIKQFFGTKQCLHKTFGPFWIHSHQYFESAKLLVYNKKICENVYNISVFKAIIPKFTLYYEGIDGDICSKKIILIEECVQY